MTDGAVAFAASCMYQLRTQLEAMLERLCQAHFEPTLIVISASPRPIYAPRGECGVARSCFRKRIAFVPSVISTADRDESDVEHATPFQSIMRAFGHHRARFGTFLLLLQHRSRAGVDISRLSVSLAHGAFRVPLAPYLFGPLSSSARLKRGLCRRHGAPPRHSPWHH